MSGRRNPPKPSRDILDGLLAAEGDIVVAVDAFGPTRGGRETLHDLVAAERAFSGNYLDDVTRIRMRLAYVLLVESSSLSLMCGSDHWKLARRASG